MPVAPGPQLNLRRSLIFAGVSVGIGIVLVLLVIALAGSGDLEVSVGQDRFPVGDATEFAAKISQDQAPRLFASLDANRPVFLNHIGEDPLTGWYAVDARSPTDPNRCALRWDVERQVFVDDCAPADTYPPDGEGLLQYRVIVEDDETVVVDLRAEDTSSS